MKLAKDWDAFRKQAEKEYLANKETPREETLQVWITSKKQRLTHSLILILESLDHEIESLSKRQKN